ncbi:hypothetical protein DIPPA_34022 [Diplonema papillatum]|nr:hypothetical protein DIPPA_34022 [Diplonema papillatum]
MAEPVQLQRLQTLTFDGPVPYPHKAVTDPNPDEHYEEWAKRQETDIKERDAAFEREQAQKAAADTSALGKFSMFAKGVAHNVSKAGTQIHGAVESKVRQEAKEREKNIWKRAFPSQQEATYHCSYTAKAMHAGHTLNGDITICSTHFNFRNNTHQESIPLADILTIQRSVVLPTVNKASPPFILPIPAEHVIPSALQIFTKSGQIFQFLDFSNTTTAATAHLTTSIHGSAIERCYNFLDHAWRAATTVPQADGSYQPAMHA